MKSITIHQLHAATRKWMRQAASLGGLEITDHGTKVARLLPVPQTSHTTPYFARRKLLPAFRATQSAGGTDSTAGISAERDER